MFGFFIENKNDLWKIKLISFVLARFFAPGCSEKGDKVKLLLEQKGVIFVIYF